MRREGNGSASVSSPSLHLDSSTGVQPAASLLLSKIRLETILLHSSRPQPMLCVARNSAVANSPNINQRSPPSIRNDDPTAPEVRINGGERHDRQSYQRRHPHTCDILSTNDARVPPHPASPTHATLLRPPTSVPTIPANANVVHRGDPMSTCRNDQADVQRGQQRRRIPI